MGPFRVCLLLCGCLVCLDFGLAPVLGLDTDIWWHLAAGQRMATHGVEFVDPFSFTFAGKHWTHIDWLFQWCAWQIFASGGVAALLWARAWLVLLSWLALWRLAILNGIGWGAGWVLSVTVCHIASQSVPLRPSAVSFFYTSLLLLLLEEARHGRRRCLLLLPALMAIWFNLHVAAIGGVLIVLLYVAGQVCARSTHLRPWLLTGVACSLAPFLNVQPLKLVIYPIQFTFFQTLWNSLVQEVQFPGWDWPGTLESRVLAALSLYATVRLARQKRWELIFLGPVCCLLLLKTYRHQFQLSPALLPAIAQFYRFPVAGVTSRLALALVATLLALRGIASLLLVKTPADNLVRRETFPEAVVSALAAHPAGLRIFTDMDAAGYYIYGLQGKHSVFIDSRTDQVYLDDEFVRQYIGILAGQPSALPELARWRVDVAINHRAAGHALFSDRLPQSKDWRLAYQDNIAELYVRKEVALRPPNPPAYLSHYNAARQFAAEGSLEEAQTAAQRSLAEYPWFSSAHQLLGRLWLNQGRAGLARRALARAELANRAAPGIQQDWARLGAPWNNSLVRAFCLPFLAW